MEHRATASTANENARHYGNMRFAMFTVFSAVCGALIAFPFSASGSLFLSLPGAAHHRTLLSLAGLALSFFFAAAEWRISYLVTFYQEAAFAENSLPKPVDHAFWKMMILITMLLPYVLSIAFWSLYLNGTITVPSIKP